MFTLPHFFRYKIVLNSDDPRFCGHNRIDVNCDFFSEDYKHDNREYSVLVGYVNYLFVHDVCFFPSLLRFTHSVSCLIKCLSVQISYQFLHTSLNNSGALAISNACENFLK